MSDDLYSEQDVEAKVIIPTLRRLGYTDKKRNVTTRYQHPINAQQGRERKTIFADVVVFVSDSPVIVVDSKNPRRYLTDNDRRQVISYARLIGDIAPYSALCNGRTWEVFDSVTKEQLRQLPSYSDLIKDLQRRRVSNRQRQSIKSQATRTLFAIDSSLTLSRLLRRCHDVIRNLKGYDPTKAFDELSKLLFVKMYEEREVSEGRKVNRFLLIHDAQQGCRDATYEPSRFPVAVPYPSPHRATPAYVVVTSSDLDTSRNKASVRGLSWISRNRFTTTAIKEMRDQGVEIIQSLWKETIESPRYHDVFADIDATETIELPREAIDQIVDVLEDKSLGQTDLDVKGVAFEEFLAGTYRGGGLGQYFTPRQVVHFMVDLVNPVIGERIIDPACGSGGFLIRIYDEVSEKIRTSELTESAKKAALTELANACLVGFDWEARAARTCKMNMIIHGDGHAGVYNVNALDLDEITRKIDERRRTMPEAPDVEDGGFDIVITNPPFGATDKVRRILDHYELGVSVSQKREVLMLERSIRLLTPGGRLAIVVPEGILSNKNDHRIRMYLLRHCLIRAVIRLPQDAFKKSDGAACTSILYAEKKNPKKSQVQGPIFFARAEYIGISPAGRPIDNNDLLAIKDAYRTFERGEWNGVELLCAKGRVETTRPAPRGDGPWLAPEVNRTSLLYDRLSYIVRQPNIQDRFSYTYFHPRYYGVMDELESMPIRSATLAELCVEGHPRRGKKPENESFQGIPILKVRNVTGSGIDLDTDFAPETSDTLTDCAKAVVHKGDVLITCTGEGTIGRVDIYPYDDPAIADGHVSICRLQDGVNRDYVVEFLRSEHGQVQMLRHVSGSTGQTELLKDHLSSLIIPVPSRERQDAAVIMMHDVEERVRSLQNQAVDLRRESAGLLAAARNNMVKGLFDE